MSPKFSSTWPVASIRTRKAPAALIVPPTSITPRPPTVFITCWRAVSPGLDGEGLQQLAMAKLPLFIYCGGLHLSRRIADDLLANSSALALAGEAAHLAGAA